MKHIIKRFFIFSITLGLSLGLGSCYPDESIREEPSEAPLVISVTPDPGSTIARTLGPSYDFQVGINSVLPAQGVSISVVYRRDSDNSIVFSQNYTTSTPPLDVRITAIPFNEVGTVTVVVTSNTNPANSQTKAFKLVRK